jgi:nucleoside-diphosphate-sugar epimerase
VKYLVSGATGFIGRQLCLQLAAGGDTVIALSKNGRSLEPGVPTLAIDLTATDPSADLLEGVDCFFHLAGIAHQKAQASAYKELNHRATIRLANLASAAGVKCFVFLSSVKAMGSPGSSSVRSENACTQPVDPYGLSKWQAESELRERFSDDAMAVVIVRPALVCGVNAKGNLLSLARGVRRGLPRPPIGGNRSMIALDDLVKLLCVVAQRPLPGVHTWIACSDQSFSLRAIYDLLRASAGLSKGVSWLPGWAWKAGSWVLDVAARQPDDSTYNKLFGAELYSNAAVLKETEWRPRTRLEDVFGEIARAEIEETC